METEKKQKINAKFDPDVYLDQLWYWYHLLRHLPARDYDYYNANRQKINELMKGIEELSIMPGVYVEDVRYKNVWNFMSNYVAKSSGYL